MSYSLPDHTEAYTKASSICYLEARAKNVPLLKAANEFIRHIEEGVELSDETHLAFIRSNNAPSLIELIGKLEAKDRTFLSTTIEKLAKAVEAEQLRLAKVTPSGPWWVTDRFTAPQCFVALSHHLSPDGSLEQRVSETISALEAAGREIANTSWLVKQLVDRGWITITEPAAGRRSAAYRLSAAGIGEAQRLNHTLYPSGPGGGLAQPPSSP
jgi:hypothetical protein